MCDNKCHAKPWLWLRIVGWSVVVLGVLAVTVGLIKCIYPGEKRQFNTEKFDGTKTDFREVDSLEVIVVKKPYWIIVGGVVLILVGLAVALSGHFWAKTLCRGHRTPSATANSNHGDLEQLHVAARVTSIEEDPDEDPEEGTSLGALPKIKILPHSTTTCSLAEPEDTEHIFDEDSPRPPSRTFSAPS